MTVRLEVYVADPEAPSAVAEAALRHGRAAAGRFPGKVELAVVPLDDPSALDRGIALEPTVLVGDLVVSVGQAPPAGHLVRAIEAALAREKH